MKNNKMKNKFFVKLFTRLVSLPDGIKVSIAAVVVWLATNAFVQLVLLVPFLEFLAQYVEPIALSFAAWLVLKIENAVPDEYGQLAIKAIEFLLVLIALFGVGAQLAVQGVAFSVW